MNETCVICHRPESTAFACPLCATQLKTWLWELAGHAADLSTTVITRQTSRRGERVMVTGGSGEQPLVVDLDAAEVAWVLHNTLAAIAKSLCEDRGQVYDGVDTSPAIAVWLARNVMSIALSPDALETWGDIAYVHDLVVRTVDIALPRVWLGRCDAVVDGAVCGMDVRATEEEAAVRCSGCMTVRNVAEFKVRVLAAAGGELATGPVLMGLLGGALKAGTLRQWKARGRVKPAMVVDGVDVWRIGEVMALMTVTCPAEAARNLLGLGVARVMT